MNFAKSTVKLFMLSHVGKKKSVAEKKHSFTGAKSLFFIKARRDTSKFIFSDSV
jgi:hypothetical protein